MDFVKLAPYLRDPLVLIGFVLFLGFLFARRLLTSGVIPPIGAGRGAQVLRLVLHYGFALGLLVILLGFGLKYRDLSESEQRTAVALLSSELEHNAYVARELEKNTTALTNVALTVAKTLRVDRLKINAGLFPASNLDPEVPQNADLYNQRFDWLQASGLLKDQQEMRRYREQNQIIVQTIDRTLSTVRSLGDRSASRYVIHEAAFDANLPVLRKVTIAKPGELASLYARTAEVRETYFRIADSVDEYLVAVKAYCLNDKPDRGALAAALASERLTLGLLRAQQAKLETLAKQIEVEANRMQAAM